MNEPENHQELFFKQWNERIRRDLGIGPLNPDLQLKEERARGFMCDATDHLEIFSMGWQSESNSPSYRSKLFFNLRMAIECYLKALVMVYSQETQSPEEAYQLARDSSHDLKRLLGQAQSQSRQTKRLLKKTTERLINEVDKMTVGLRYEADLAAATDREPFQPGPLEDTIGSDKWMHSLRKHIEYIRENVDQAYNQRFGKRRILFGDDLEKLRNRRLDFWADNFGCYGNLPNPNKGQPGEWPVISCDKKKVMKCKNCNAKGCSAQGCTNQNFIEKPGPVFECLKCGYVHVRQKSK
jgi:hypothetical protein